MGVIVCKSCKKEKPESNFHWRKKGVTRHKVCKTCRAADQKKNYNYARVRDKHLQRRYGIDQKEYSRIWEEQGEKCAVCKTTPQEHHKNKFHVDHDHETGQIRGILCATCNATLGKLGDGLENVERVLLYLQRGDYRVSWDEYFLRLADQVSTRSKDRSSQVGAVVVKDQRIVSTGYNGLPRNVNDAVLERNLRPAKYSYFEHAERNAIYNCAREGLSTKDATIYVNFLPCCDCARAIIQSGINRVVARSNQPLSSLSAVWDKSVEIGMTMFEEAGIEVTIFEDFKKEV